MATDPEAARKVIAVTLERNRAEADLVTLRRRLQELIARWRHEAQARDDGTGITACAISAAGNRVHADDLAAVLAEAGVDD